MAQIPYDGAGGTVAPDTRVPDDYEKIDVNPDQFGAAIGKGLQQAGQGAVQTSSNLFDAEKFHEENAVTDQLNQLRTTADQIRWGLGQNGPNGKPVPGALQLEGKAAMDAAPAAIQQIQQAVDAGKQNLQTPWAKLEFEKESRRWQSTWHDEIGRHVDAQSKAWGTEVNQSDEAHWKNHLARNPWDPDAIIQGTNGIVDAYVKNAELHGATKGDSVWQASRETGLREALKARLDAIAVSDPGGAIKKLDQFKNVAGAEYDNLYNRYRVAASQQRGIENAESRISGRAPIPTDTADFLRARGPGARTSGMSGDFAGRLQQAVQDAEAATGSKTRIESLRRTTEQQAELYRRYQTGQGGLAAPPGQSRHEIGEAADIADGPVLNWLHSNAGKYGLEFLSGKAFQNDSGHIQLASGSAGVPQGSGSGLPQGGVAGLRQGRAALPNKGDVMVSLTDDMRDDPTALSAALAHTSQVYSAYENQQIRQNVAFDQRVNDGLAEARQNGAATLPVTQNEFAAHYGSVEGPARYQSYQSDLRYAADYKALEGMSDVAQQQFVNARTPTPGSPGYARDVENQERLVKAAHSIETQRRDDPAGSVSRLPAVQEALAKYDQNRPETFAPVAAARLAAQAQLGIAPEERAPITKDEALKLTAPLRTMLPGQERDTLTKIGETFKSMFGDNAESAFSYALRAHKVDAATAEIGARIARKVGIIDLPTHADAQQLDDAKEADAATRAVTGPAWYERMLNTGAAPELSAAQDAIGGAAAQRSAPAAAQRPADAKKAELPRDIQPRAVNYLLTHPDTAAAFDQEYGRAGLGKQILEKYSSAVRHAP